MNTANPVSSAEDATARPASWSVPMWPTTAVSASTYSGSATSAPERGHGQAGDLPVVGGAEAGHGEHPGTGSRYGPASVTA